MLKRVGRTSFFGGAEGDRTPDLLTASQIPVLREARNVRHRQEIRRSRGASDSSATWAIAPKIEPSSLIVESVDRWMRKFTGHFSDSERRRLADVRIHREKRMVGGVRS